MELLKVAPPKLWEDLHRALLRMSQDSLSQDGASKDHDRLIMFTFLTGLLLSTGARGQELAHLRLDEHLPLEFFDATYRGSLDVPLRSVDRKNEVSHTVSIRPWLVPAWLRIAYLETRSRYLQRSNAVRPGEPDPESTSTSAPPKLSPSSQVEAREWPLDHRFGLSPGEWHQHLLVYQNGDPVGDLTESWNGERGLSRADLESRVNRLRDLWKNYVGRILWRETEWDCPTGDGLWTFHAIRNVMGYAFYQQSPLAAMNYLGIGPTAVRLAYSGVSGIHISQESFARALRWLGREIESGPDGNPLAVHGSSRETQTIVSHPR